MQDKEFKELHDEIIKEISRLKKNNIALDRKILSELATNRPEIFQQVVEKVR